MPYRFVARDRRTWLIDGVEPAVDRAGTALFLDITGFTPLTNALAESSGRAAAEEIGELLNQIYGPLIEEVQRYGGSVVGFAGDAITAWFDDDDGRASTVAALCCQQVLDELGSVSSSAGTRRLEGRITITRGAARRAAVGDPDTQLFDALIGDPIDRLAGGDQLAEPGEVLADEAAAAVVGSAGIAEWRASPVGRFAVIRSGTTVATPEIAADFVLPPLAKLRPWVHHRVQEMIEAGNESLLSENRPAVTMFLGFDGIDFLGSNALEQLDGFVRSAQAVLFQHGGTPLSLSIGDKGAYMLITFGVPQAHRDDPIRALAAAEALRVPPEGSAVTGVRIGLSSAPLWAGMLGGATRMFYSVVGDGVNVAARLMTKCQPGEVLVVGDFSSAAGRFEIWPMPTREIKGHPGVIASEVIGYEHDAATRLQDTPYAFPMVGRAAELAVIEARLLCAMEGAGGVITISGEAGIGKSRLADQVLHQALAKGFRTAGSASNSYETKQPYIAWHRTLRMLLDIRPTEPADRQQARLVRALGQMGPEAAAMAPLFGPVLGIEIADNEHTAPIPAPARKEILSSMTMGMLGAMSGAQPILIVLDNTQWSDPLSRELLATLAVASTEMRVVVLALHTDDTEQAGLDLDGASTMQIRLAALDETDMDRFIEFKLVELFGLTGARPEVLSAVVRDRAQGNPLFCEELLRDVSDLGIDPLDEEAPAAMELPESVQRLVLDRLDRLPFVEQSVVRHVSVLGLRFPVEWIAGMGFADLDQLAAALHRLAEAQILTLHLKGDGPEYAFASATMRDVVYESIGIASRRQLHERVGLFLEAEAQISPIPIPIQLLASHFQRAENPVKELQYTGLAGEAALGAAAYESARDLFERGLELVGAAGDASLAVPELGLNLGLGAALLALEGQQSDLAHQCYERAFNLLEKKEPGPEAARAMFGLWTHYLFLGELHRSSELARRLLADAEMIGFGEAIMQAHLAVSLTVYWLGDLAGTVEHAEKMLALYDPTEAAGYVARYAQNPRVTGMTDAVWATWMLGRPAEAIAMGRETQAHADSLGHGFVATIAAQILPVLYVHMGDVDAAETAGVGFMAKAKEMGNPVYIGLATVVMGWVAGSRGAADDGLEMLLAVRAGMSSEGVHIMDPLLVTLAADVCLRADRPERGLELIDDFLVRADLEQHCLYLPEQLRLKAEFLARDGGDPDEIAGLLEQAGSIASATGNVAYRIRALTSQLRLDVGDHRTIVERLDEQLAAVIDGDGNPDVIAARAQLAEGAV